MSHHSWNISPLFATGAPWRAARGKIQPNHNPAVQGEMQQAGGVTPISLSLVTRASPLHTVLHRDVLLFSSRG